MKMVIKQILNTNAVISNDENGQDVLLLGSGLGFKSRIGDAIDQERVEKQFILKDKNHKSQFREILDTVPQEYIMVAEDVIDFAVQVFDMTLNETIHISLVDHIYHAVENFQQGLVVPNSILHDIIRFYPDEYKVGQKMLDLIESRFGYRLSNDEAGFVAMHFVTARHNQISGNAKKMIVMVSELNDLIMSELNFQVKEDSLPYYRYMTHLKFFAQRVMKKYYYKEHGGARMLEELLRNYPDEYRCSQKVCQYIEDKYHYKAGHDELVYLAVHLSQLKNS
ncbi:PRD domain-containing protein [Lacrimispora amygdalina]|nr:MULTISPECIES: PRD domain-containing protein [Clostridia]NNJ29493.1 PRD domain-containing protein [Lacrimispora defluvii]RFZ76965.1 PRD domain-containing protein [Clostridium indicum]